MQQRLLPLKDGGCVAKSRPQQYGVETPSLWSWTLQGTARHTANKRTNVRWLRKKNCNKEHGKRKHTREFRNQPYKERAKRTTQRANLTPKKQKQTNTHAHTHAAKIDYWWERRRRFLVFPFTAHRGSLFKRKNFPPLWSATGNWFGSLEGGKVPS